MKTKAEIRSSGYGRLSDEALIHRYVHRHDEIAVYCLFDRYGHLVYGVCRKYLGKAESSVSATIHLFTRLLDDLKKYPVEQFRPWLLRATVNYCLAQLRGIPGANLPPEIITDMQPGTAAPGMPESALSRSPAAAIPAALPEEQRTCLEMFYLERMTYARVSAATGFTITQVKDFIRCGRKNLIENLAAPGRCARMSDLLDHIFERSVCLTKRQMRDYVSGVMAEEECYVVEVHLNSCTFCSEAAGGLLPADTESLEALHKLNPDFIGEHARRTMPQIHLNSIAPAAPAGDTLSGHHHRSSHAWWRMMPVAAVLALACFLLRERNPGEEQVPHLLHIREKATLPVPLKVLPEGKSQVVPGSKTENITKRTAGSKTAGIKEGGNLLSGDRPVPTPADSAETREHSQLPFPLATEKEKDGLRDARPARAETEESDTADTTSGLKKA